MCGLTGFISRNLQQNQTKDVLEKMTNAIRHRGPDHTGHWFEDAPSPALGHCRLSILDLSPQGHQPMHSSSGRYVMAYNGEVYNFLQIKEALKKESVSFKGGSDTEVILAAIEKWGLKEAIGRFVGMFAFALWDRQDKKLFLVRDRLGIKPLYYGWQKDSFIFGSELKAFNSHPDFAGALSTQALQSFFTYSYVPSPQSIYKDISKVEPGHIVTIHPFSESRTIDDEIYWSSIDEMKRAKRNSITDLKYAQTHLESQLEEAVQMRMISDVSLGAFLSGGIDSSLVVSLMQKTSSKPIQTFTIGFDQKEFNEAGKAKKVAQHLGTQHTEQIVTSKEAQDVIPEMGKIYDEPFADTSQIPTFLISRMTRQHVTVSLSGDGGDELFGGYPRYQEHAGVRHRQQLAQLIPSFLRSTIKKTPFSRWAHLSEIKSQEELYRYQVSYWQNSSDLMLNPHQTVPFPKWDSNLSAIENMMAIDAISYLPDEILVKLDRASMAVGLEARVPLLDHRVFQLAWRIPRKNKNILKNILYKYVPKSLLDRPKMGFGVPVATWIRGPLKEWAESHLNEKSLKESGVLNPQPIRQRWIEHCEKGIDWHASLWTVLMFQEWRSARKS